MNPRPARRCSRGNMNSRPEQDDGGALTQIGMAMSDWAERWFPDALVFAMLAIVVVLRSGALRRKRRVGPGNVPARQLNGYTALQLIVNLPLVLLILWVLARTLPYSPPHFP